jgi:hypothetical protein
MRNSLNTFYYSKAVPQRTYEGAGGKGSYSFTTSALDGVVSVTPRPRVTPRKRTSGTHWAGGWVGPRAGLDTEATGKILLPLPGIEPRPPGRPVRSQTLYGLSYPGSLEHLLFKGFEEYEGS